MKQRKLTRREFLMATGILLGATMAPIGGDWLFRLLKKRNDIHRKLKGRFSDPRAAQKVGQAYLKATPEERDLDRLVARLDSLDWDFIAAASKEDFKRRNTVKLNGWILSRIEARVCALLHLSA